MYTYLQNKEMKQKKTQKDNLPLINVIWKHIVKTNTFTH